MDFSEAFSPTRAISHGIEGLKRQPVGVLLGGFLMMITQGGGGGGGNFAPPMEDGQSPEMTAAFAAIALVVFVVVAVLGVVFWLARSFLHTGWIRMHRDLVVGGQAEVGTLFSGKDAFGRMALWKLLKGVIVMGTMLAAVIPGGLVMLLAMVESVGEVALVLGGVLMVLTVVPVAVYVGLGLSLGEFAVALEEARPMEALERSWDLANGNRWTLLGFYIVTSMFAFVGFLACCIGVFVTRAIADVGTTESYLLATRDDTDSFAFVRMDRGEILPPPT